MHVSSEIEALISRLSRLPGLGPKSARRMALALLQDTEGRLRPLAASMNHAADRVRVCSQCGNLDTIDPCHICCDHSRKAHPVCVVETVGDLWALERSHIHQGTYQVLGGNLSAMGGKGPEDLNLTGLQQRLEEGTVKEVIVALSATLEGATTAHWLQSRLDHYKVKVTMLGHGMPAGGTLESLDDGTLTAALLSRRQIEDEE